MSGYTPIFQSVFTGTLHGQWPDVGLWLCLLAMADRHGNVDCTPAYIASVTGMAVSEVQACIDRFLDRDEFSRTRENDGRRLELLDDSRPWGWRIVNHGRYREKARLMAKDAARTESGKDAERKRVMRQANGSTANGVPLCPPSSPSQTQTKHKLNKTKKDEEALATARAVDGLDINAFEKWMAYRQEIKKPIKSISLIESAKQLSSFGNNQMAVVNQSIANSWQGLFELKQTAQSTEVARSKRALELRNLPTADEIEARELARGGHSGTHC